MTTDRRTSRTGTGVLVVSFAACVILANWALLHIGVDNGPDQPRTIPLGFGLHAPSGVLFAGALFTLRDLIHERVGAARTLAVVVVTAPLTAVASAPSIALASLVTFLIAEVADWAVYTRVRPRGRGAAVVASNVVSSFVDSAVFLTLAFGGAPAFQVVAGMTLGKFAASAATFALIAGAVRLAAAQRPAASTARAG